MSTLELEFLLKKDIENIDVNALVDNWKTWPEVEAEIREICKGKPGHMARCLEETKAKYPNREQLRRQLTILKECWADLSEKIRNKII